MTKAIQLTSADSTAHNLYALILAGLSVTQLPQRVDRGAVFFPDFVAKVTFSLAASEDTGNSIALQDQDGNEMYVIAAGSSQTIGPGNKNTISLQALKLKASGTGVITDVAIEQV